MQVADHANDGACKAHINKGKEEQHLAQRLQQDFLGTSHQSQLITLNAEAEVVPSPTKHHSKPITMEDVEASAKVALRIKIWGLTPPDKYQKSAIDMEN